MVGSRLNCSVNPALLISMPEDSKAAQEGQQRENDQTSVVFKGPVLWEGKKG